jgi:hypothetical protein
MFRRSGLFAAFALMIAQSLYAALPSDDLFLPIVGRMGGAGGHQFFTTLWLTNPGRSRSDVHFYFLVSGQPNGVPHDFELSLAPAETKVFPRLDEAVFGKPAAVGALRIRASRPVIATARTFSLDSGQPLSRASSGATFDGIPGEVAIGNGESAFVHGVAFATPRTVRNKLYVVETAGRPFSYAVTPIANDGKGLARRTFFIRPYEHDEIDLDAQFPVLTSETAALRVDGVNGSGRIIFAAITIANESRDTNAYEMSFPLRPRFAIGGWEGFAYGAVGIALIVAAVGRWRRRT